MKFGQIFKIVLCSFLIQNIQVGFGGEVAKDFSKNFTIIDKGEGLFDIVDDEGNILKDVSKDQLDMLKAGRYRTLKSLQITEGLEEANFLKAGSDEAKTFLEQNDLTQATLDRLRGRTINFSDLRRTGIRGKASEAYSVIELQDVNRAKIYTSKIETLSKSVAQHTTEGLDGLASDLQAVNTGKKSIQSVVSKYKKILTGVSDDNLGRLDVLSPDGKPLAVTSAGKETYAERGEQIRTETIDRLNQLAQDFKSAAGNAVEKARLLGDLSQACTKIVTDDAMSEIAALGSSIQRDSAKLSNMDGQLNSILKNQVEDIQQATGALKLEDFLDDSKKIIKDAAGNDIAVSAIESKLEGLSKDMDASSGQILNDLKQDIAVRVEELSKKAGIAGRFSASIFYRDGALEDLGKTLSRKAQSVTTHDVADAFASAGEKLQKAGGYAFEKLKEVGMVMVSSVLFMLPNIFQSSFLALKQRMVQLETLATPIQFGNWVVQIPASCIDIDNPGTGTIPLYLAVPVQQYGNSLSAEAITHFKGSVGDLTANNSVSDAIHTTGAALFSLGESSHYKISRYSMKESAYLSHNPDIVGTFFAPGGYQAWLSLPVTSSQFTSGEMIALNTGFVADYTGQQQNATAIVPEFFMSYPLKIDTDFDWHGVQPQQPLSPSDVSAFLMQLGAKLGLSDNNVKFTEYVNVNQGSHGPMVNQSLVDACNCACLDPNAAVCTDHNCMLRKTLDAYQAGLSFNKNGVVGFSNTNVTENKFTNLGSVSSLFGWGESWYPDNINQTTFPGFSYDFSQLMATRANTTNKQPSANQSPVNFANEAINFAAQGCWVYLSSSTPFARAVQATSSQTSLTGPYVDYIIFLDNQNNIVPLHVPIQKQRQVLGYTSTQLGLNPKIKYWTSIASFYNNQILPIFADQKTGNPIKYDLKGNAWADPNLAGTFSQNTPPGTAVLASAIANLQQTFDGKLFDQFSVHQQAMIDKLNNGPFAFGNNLLVASPYTIQVPGNSPNTGVNITLYRGSTCYASSIDDLFVAFDSQNQPVTLPAADVTSLYSLVTDIAYTVNTDGSLTPEFSNAPLVQNTNGSYSINSANLGTYYYLDQYLESNLEQMQPLAKGASPYVDLCNGAVCSGGAMSVAQYVAQQRTAWSEQFDSSLQKQGIDFGSFICTMPAEFSSKKAVAANAYIYEVVPSPSAGLCDHDLFVISNAANQALASLQPIDAQIADKQSVLISLVTGFVFNTSGTQMMNADGSAVRIVTPVSSMTSAGDVNKVQSIGMEIFNAVTSKFKLQTVVDQAFVDKYQSWVKQYEIQMHRVMGPYSFGSLSVVIFAGDYANSNYVYLSSVGHHKKNFDPSDIFITYDPVEKTFGTELTAKTPYMISLVSGNQYDAQGNIVGTLQEQGLLSLTQGLSDKWGNWLLALVTQRQAENKKQLQAEQEEQERLDDLFNAIAAQHDIVMTSDVANQIISRLQPTGTQGLPVPYGLLKYDPVSGHFVHVSPLATATSTGFIYLFFNIGTDKKTGKNIGGIYYQDGTGAHCVHIVKDVHLKALQDQFGVVVNGDTQTLTVPVGQPPLYMSTDAQTIVAGSDSQDEDLIVSSSEKFPAGPIKITAKNMYLYYSQTMQAYYIWDAKKSEWISVVADHEGNGYVYDKTGKAIANKQKVAISTSSATSGYGGVSAADDLMLLYDNTQGNPQAYMSDGFNYSNIDQTTGTMNWTALDATSDTSLIVTQNKSKYTVKSGTKTTIYQINNDYAWYQLIAVPSPVDASGNLDMQGVDSDHANAQLITSNGAMSHMLFNHVMYKVAAASGDTYTLVPVKSIEGKLQLTLGQDLQTGAAFVRVDDGEKVYTYMYINKMLSADELSVYQALIGGTTATSTQSFEVGSADPAKAKTVTLGKSTINIAAPKATTNVLFAKNIATAQGSTLALTAVSSASIQEIPQKGDKASQFKISEAAFLQNISLIFKSSDGRFLVRIPDSTQTNTNNVIPTFSYVSRAYVDLGTGILYSADTGVSLGYCLNFDDWLSVLNALQVSALLVTTESDKRQWQLFYRTPKVIEVETVTAGQNAVMEKMQE